MQDNINSEQTKDLINNSEHNNIPGADTVSP
jgi:hypothetical protein